MTRIVAAKAKRANPNISIEDARQEARLGLIEAVDKYDPHNERGAKFTTFATTRMGFQAIEAARQADWCSPKIRASEKRGEISLPAMIPMPRQLDADQAGESEQTEAERELDALTRQCNPAAQYFANGMARVGQLTEKLGEEWGCSAMCAAVARRWTIEKLREAVF
jgi:hypothetical protein